MNKSDQALEDARRAGIDLDLTDINLALSVQERWAQHSAALELFLQLEEARKVRDAKLRSAAGTIR